MDHTKLVFCMFRLSLAEALVSARTHRMNSSVVSTLVILSICQIFGLPTGDTPKDGLVYTDKNGTEGYYFRYELADQDREERGEFVNGIWTVTGKASWTSPDGEKHQFSYIADDKGYRVVSPLPVLEIVTPPPVFSESPVEILGIGSGALASLAG